MERHRTAPLAWLGLLALGAASVTLSASQEQPNIGALMARIGDRVASYYRRAQQLICDEQSTVQPIGSNWGPNGLSRTVESEVRVEFDASDGNRLPEAKVIRDVHRINGRAPRERDRTDRSGCTDPNPLSPEPLAFLLPAHRDDYQFTSVREGRERNRAALVIDFRSTKRTSRPELIEDERGHADCFDWSGSIAMQGRVWVDAATGDVLRVDRGVQAPVDILVPWALQQRYQFGSSVVIERDDQSLRYTMVSFNDPDEAILLPQTIESVTILHGGLQSIRRSETFSNYRRFLTAGRIGRAP
jgi:hypothetical protein